MISNLSNWLDLGLNKGLDPETQLSPDQLMLVTGCTYTADWSKAVFRAESKAIKFGVNIGETEFANANFSAAIKVEEACKNWSEKHWGPLRREGDSEPLHRPLDQCLFVRGFKVGTRAWYMSKLSTLGISDGCYLAGIKKRFKNNNDPDSNPSSSSESMHLDGPNANQGSTSGETGSGQNPSSSAEGGAFDSSDGLQEEAVPHESYGLVEEAPVATLEEFIDRLIQDKPVIWLENSVGQIGELDAALGIRDKDYTLSHPGNFVKPSESSIILINTLLKHMADYSFYFDMTQPISSIDLHLKMASLGEKATHPAMTLMGIAIYSNENLSVIAVRNNDGVTVMDVFSALSKAFQLPTRVSITDEKSLSLSASQLEALEQAAHNLLGAVKGDESDKENLGERRVFAGLTEYAEIPNIWFLNTISRETLAISGWRSPFSLELKEAKLADHSVKRRHAENEEEEGELRYLITPISRPLPFPPRINSLPLPPSPSPVPFPAVSFSPFPSSPFPFPFSPSLASHTDHWQTNCMISRSIIDVNSFPFRTQDDTNFESSLNLSTGDNDPQIQTERLEGDDSHFVPPRPPHPSQTVRTENDS
ncbi:hypothetical protein M422DRAFT_272507 [Sphaerobolus stellatus SS14]|uniref:DUF6699 domain-containing protein n=1 Tax=Sphaerobolus stellatus (strain SS14) TaxID=990650 RepID=A0A0C9ULX3_SPHS4|nr:hypothetical protein M422DRAFT_272507 [Sphaerobolus stellatus SS14]